MYTVYHKNQTHPVTRIVSILIILAFIGSFVRPLNLAQAQTILDATPPGTKVMLSPEFTPPVITGITVHPENPLQFDFIIDAGDDNLSGQALEEESKKLIKYFMASLTVPEDKMWVNLSPYEKDRIIADDFGQTEMGRDLLAQDYLLKQLSASLMYPEDELGKKFWDRVYQKALDLYGITDIPMDTFHKIWIVPQKASVYTKDKSVFVVNSKLSVMIEDDYLALSHNSLKDDNSVVAMLKKDTDKIEDVSSDVIKEILIPEIEKEVNHGKNFANLRQIYNSMILATWYKKNLKESLLGQVYVNQGKTLGIDVKQEAQQRIYDQYVASFEKGVYDYIREDYDPTLQQVLPKKYFGGGVDLRADVKDQGMVTDAWIEEQAKRTKVQARADLRAIKGDRAQLANFQEAVDISEEAFTNGIVDAKSTDRIVVVPVTGRPRNFSAKLTSSRLHDYFWFSMRSMLVCLPGSVAQQTG